LPCQVRCQVLHHQNVRPFGTGQLDTAHIPTVLGEGRCWAAILSETRGSCYTPSMLAVQAPAAEPHCRLTIPPNQCTTIKYTLKTNFVERLYFYEAVRVVSGVISRTNLTVSLYSSPDIRRRAVIPALSLAVPRHSGSLAHLPRALFVTRSRSHTASQSLRAAPPK
jgi:hypothetical protein